MNATEILRAMKDRHLRVAHLVADGEMGDWVLIDILGHAVAAIDSAVAQGMVHSGQLVLSAGDRRRGKYENEIYRDASSF